MSNIKSINLGDKDKMRAAVEEMKRSLPTWLEHAELTAKIRRASYDAHIKEGFTPAEALELCKSLLL